MIDIENETSLLGEIAANNAENSEEQRIIRLASQALIYVWHEETRTKFQDFLYNFDRDLTEKKRFT